jgi:hypothetical protein
MTNRETGVYVRLLAFQWVEGSITNDLDDLAALVKEPRRDFDMMWRRVGKCFVPTPGDKNRLQNNRLEEVRMEQLAKTQVATDQRRQAGIRSGEARRKAAGKPTGPELPLNGRSTSVQRERTEEELDTKTDSFVDKSTSESYTAALALAVRKPRTKDELTAVIESIRPPERPEGMPIDWPADREDMAAVRHLALYFIGEFSNIGDPKKITRHIGPFATALITLRARDQSVIAAWYTFHRMRAADRKPILGERALQVWRHIKPSERATR